MAENYSSKILHALTCYLDKKNIEWRFEEASGSLFFGLLLSSKGPYIDYYADIAVDHYLLFAHTGFPEFRNNSKRLTVLTDYINRANGRLPVGCFLLFAEENDIIYKYFTDCRGSIPHRVIRNSLQEPAMAIVKYGVGMLDIIDGAAPAKVVLENVEAAWTDEIDSFEDENDS